MLKYNGSLSHVLGLYSLALEEYGKAKLLEEIKLKTPELNQKYRIQRSEYYKHESKLQKAFKFLPKECTHVNISVVVKDNTSNKNQIIKIHPKIKNSILTIGAYQTGTFGTINGVTLIEKLRWRCFFIDYDDTKDCWVEEFIFDKKEIIECISIFKNHINNDITPECISIFKNHINNDITPN